MKRSNFWTIFLISLVIWYAGISFVRWEFDWVRHLSDATRQDRLWFFLAFIGKVAVDWAIYLMLNSSSRSEEEQRTYHYDEDGNDIVHKSKIN